jgi:protein-disulfide isomerase
MTSYKSSIAAFGLLLLGCIARTPRPVEAQISRAEVKNSVSASEDCAHVQQVICQMAGEKSAECKAAANTLPLMSSKACAAAREDEKNIESRVREIRLPCTTLVDRLCTDLGNDKDTCGLVRTQTSGFAVERCKLLTQRYPEVLAELRKVSEAGRPLTLPQQSLIADGNRPSFGPLDAKVVVVEFSDFQCPYCLTTANTVHEIRLKFERQVRFVFRQYPLNFHVQAHLAAQASLAAHAQGKFWELHDLLFAHQKALERKDIEAYAASAGLNMDDFRKNLDESSFNSVVAEDIDIGNQVHVQGTPTMFINGKRVTNPSDTPAVLNAIHAALILEFSRRKSNQALLSW